MLFKFELSLYVFWNVLTYYSVSLKVITNTEKKKKTTEEIHNQYNYYGLVLASSLLFSGHSKNINMFLSKKKKAAVYKYNTIIIETNFVCLTRF